MCEQWSEVDSKEDLGAALPYGELDEIREIRLLCKGEARISNTADSRLYRHYSARLFKTLASPGFCQ
jgi:hypothetical protein